MHVMTVSCLRCHLELLKNECKVNRWVCVRTETKKLNNFSCPRVLTFSLPLSSGFSRYTAINRRSWVRWTEKEIFFRLNETIEWYTQHINHDRLFSFLQFLCCSLVFFRNNDFYIGMEDPCGDCRRKMNIFWRCVMQERLRVLISTQAETSLMHLFFRLVLY